MAKELSKKLGCDYVSFGDTVRAHAKRLNTSDDRRVLQEIGQKLIETELESFCKEVVFSKGWDVAKDLVVDGIRHVAVLHMIKSIVKPARVILVYLKVNNSSLNKRGSFNDKELLRSDYEMHRTEYEVIYSLEKHADVLQDANQEIEAVVSGILLSLENKSNTY